MSVVALTVSGTSGTEPVSSVSDSEDSSVLVAVVIMLLTIVWGTKVRLLVLLKLTLTEYVSTVGVLSKSASTKVNWFSPGELFMTNMYTPEETDLVR